MSNESTFAPLPSRELTPALLTKWRDTVQRSVMTIGRVRQELAAKNPAGMNTPEDDALITTQEELRHVSAGLHKVAPPVPVADYPDVDLFALDTSDTRELLELLTSAVAVAERVDASRGRTIDKSIPIGPDESRGTDLAEIIAEIRARVRADVQGATGKGLE